MTFNPAIVISSRKESSRIPEKAFKKVAGVPAIEHIIRRVKKTGVRVVIAVPVGQGEAYNKFAKKYRVEVFEGDPSSPLHRLREFLIDNRTVTHIVRVTHDDIIIDAQTLREMLAEAKARPELGYIYSPAIVEGAGVEVIARENIIHAAKHNGPTEFISYFVRGPGLPKPAEHNFPPRGLVCRPYRLTMDYPADWQVLNIVLSKVGKDAPTENICFFLDHHPELLNINALPILTVYTCAHNAEGTIAKTIASVLSAGIERMEYIIVDDGSTDNTVAEIAKFSRDRRIKLIVNGSNRGLASSSNIAVDESRGKFIMRVDADDMLVPESFSAAFAGMAQGLKDGLAVVYPAYYQIGESSGQVQGDINHHAGGALMLRSVMNEIRFKDGLRHWDSLELYKRIKRRARKVGYYRLPTFFYRVHGKSMSKAKANLETRARMFLSLGLGGLTAKKAGK